MPVLLLARGSPESKTLLRRAIEARYGLGPPAIETLKVELKGRARTRLGPLTTWLPVEGTAYFKFPLGVRWNFANRPAGVTVNGGAIAFDGAVCRNRRDSVVAVDDAAQVASARARVWAVNAVLLSPLAEHFVELRQTGEYSLDALNLDAGVTAHLHLNEDHTLERAFAECLNPSSHQTQTYSLRLSDGQAVVGDLMLPRKLSVFWDEDADMELAPLAAENNPTLEETLFRLESD